MILYILIFICVVRGDGILSMSGIRVDQLKVEQIEWPAHVMVEVQPQLYHLDQIKKVYLKATYRHRNKKAAFQHFYQRYDKMVQFMIKQQLIPFEDALIHSRVHERYWRRRKKWEFNRVFFLCGKEKLLERSVEQLKKKFPLEVVRSSTLTNYLNEKVLALESFNIAKAQLSQFLSAKFMGEYTILSTQDIQIIGQEIENEDIIQKQIQIQNEDRNMDINRRDSIYQDKEISLQDKIKKLKVLFLVGKPEPQEEQDEDEEKTTQESASQFQRIVEENQQQNDL